MSLGSFEYCLVFLPVVVLGNWCLGRVAPQLRLAWLILASFVFYAWSGFGGVPYLLGSALFNFWIGRRLTAATAPKQKVLFLRLGLIGNAGQLLVIKYSTFLLGVIHANNGSAHGALPMGISFFTLIQIMYVLDCYEGLTPAHDLTQHLLFSSFFPYVALGPLVRARDLKPALVPGANPGMAGDESARGFELFVLGLFKKTVLAQSCAHLADSGWGMTHPSMIEAWVATLAFAFELYFDFGGYSDMAIGSALFFGVKLPQNFDSPYRATSIIAFWRRWHMSLSAFITTYLYTPLLRLKRRPTFGWAMWMTVIAMTIAGLWHGAAWTFVVFGLSHGLALVLNNVWRRAKWRFPSGLGWLSTFLFVVLTLVLFRAADLGAAREMFASMLGAHGLRGFDSELFLGGGPGAVRAVVAVLAVVLCFAAPSSNSVSQHFRPTLGRALAVGLLALAAAVFMNSLAAKEFIYRDF